MNNREFNKKKRVIFFALLLFFVVVVFLSSTFAYFSYNGSIVDVITGNAGSVDLELDVDRILPVNSDVDSLLVFRYYELADNLNDGCADIDDEYATCHLYRVNLKNKDNSVNVKLKGSLSFNNPTMPNLSWILLGETYDSNVSYNTGMFSSNFNTAVSEFTPFVDERLLLSDDEITFYILVWLNEIDVVQYDRGSFSGIVKFEDSNGKGITAEFGDI